MVTAIDLIDLSILKNLLIAEVNQKIASQLLNGLNDNFANKYQIKASEVELLIDAIEMRLRRCQMIDSLWFKTIDYSILSGNAKNLPFEATIDFNYSGSIVSQTFKVSDKVSYFEMISSNFQNFVLTIASVLENLVLLKEMLIKKVIIHLANDAPLSTPMKTYVDFLSILVNLGYRQPDNHYRCIQNHIVFFNKYLTTINMLRNSYIHGYSIHFNTNTYTITRFDKLQFSSTSPELELHNFVDIVLTNVVNFTEELINHLITSTKVASISIPA